MPGLLLAWAAGRSNHGRPAQQKTHHRPYHSPHWNGWQFCSETGIPGYAARTCAKMTPLSSLVASRFRFSLFHAGVMLVKTCGHRQAAATWQRGLSVHQHLPAV